MGILDDLAGHMQANGLGTVGTDIFKVGLVDAPVQQYGLLHSGGLPPLRTLENQARTDQPTIQVLSRAVNYNDAEIRAMNVYLLFDAILEEIIGTAKYGIVEPQQYPFLLEWQRSDQDRRAAVFAFNCQIRVKR